jgi:hypothetical protein
MKWRSPPKTDDEFVETVRKTVVSFERWKPWLIPLIAVLCFAPVLTFVMMFQFLSALLDLLANAGGNPNRPFAWAGFAIGLPVGMSVGVSIHSAFAQFGQIMFGLRTERLLLRYYDAYQHNSGEESPSNNQDDHSEDRH